MHTSTPPHSSRADSAAVNTESFLLRCRRFLRMMLRDRSAALGVAWNLAFLAIGATVLGVSNKEEPCMPLRVWIVGHLLLCVTDFLCVILRFRRRMRRSTLLEGSSSSQWSFSSGREENSFTKHIPSAYGVLLCIWLIVGFYWVTAGGQSLKRDSPQLYWLCVTILASHGVIVLICIALVCLVGIAYCCNCLPCIHDVVTDQEGATMEEIDQLPKYKFRMIKEFKKEGDAQESFRGMITECGSDSAAEHVIATEDAECYICLSAYDDGAELREFPCNHHFHCTCIDKWLLINATCPLCKFNIFRIGNLHQEV